MPPVIRAYDATVESVDKDSRSLVARINTASVDRYNTVIDPKGGKWRNWEKLGKPVLWEHGKDARRFTDPIANAQWIRHSGGQRPTEILAKPKFLDDDFSQQRFEWYRDGVLTGWSVNILPDEGSASPPTKEELRSAPHWEGAQLIYRSWDLAEFSGTVIPGNAEALTAGRTGQLLDYVRRDLIWLPDEARTLLDEAIARYITHSDGKWTVHAEDGKPMGTYGSQEEAEERLREIEYFKHHPERTMTESGGLATGGGSVKPGWFVRKKGDKYIVHDDRNQVVSEHDDPLQAQAALGVPLFTDAARGAGLEHEITCDGQTWTLRIGGEVIVASEDAAVVEQASRALLQSRTWQHVHDSIVVEQAARHAAMAAEITEKLDLKLRGIV